MTRWDAEEGTRGELVWRVGVLIAAAVALAVALWRRGPMPQTMEYFLFADTRKQLGIPNACNVLSNVAFAVVGLAGLRPFLRGRAALRDRRERAPWLVFFAGVTLTSAGSAWFHRAPTIDSLVWDRLPMSVAFMALLAALVAERIDAGSGARLLPPLVLAGVGSVVYWWASERVGAGDLRPYLLVQFYPLLAVPLVLVLFRPRYTGSTGWAIALGAYVLAKLAEAEDADIFARAPVSGHTLKHLLAAAGIGALAWMTARRRVRAPPADAGEGVIGRRVVGAYR